jgi:hypothetical protein
VRRGIGRHRKDWALARHGMRFNTVAGYYYYPGFHEPSSGSAVGVNKGIWESFDASTRRIFEAVAASSAAGDTPYARALSHHRISNDGGDSGILAVISAGRALLRLARLAETTVPTTGSGWIVTEQPWRRR